MKFMCPFLPFKRAGLKISTFLHVRNFLANRLWRPNAADTPMPANFLCPLAPTTDSLRSCAHLYHSITHLFHSLVISFTVSSTRKSVCTRGERYRGEH